MLNIEVKCLDLLVFKGLTLVTRHRFTFPQPTLSDISQRSVIAINAESFSGIVPLHSFPQPA